MICARFPRTFKNTRISIPVNTRPPFALDLRDILAHLGEPTAPPRIAPARGPPLWEAVSAKHAPTPDPALLPTPAFEFDQRLTW